MMVLACTTFNIYVARSEGLKSELSKLKRTNSIAAHEVWRKVGKKMAAMKSRTCR